MSRRALFLVAGASVAFVGLFVSVALVLAPRLPEPASTVAPEAVAITFAEQAAPPPIATDREPGWAGVVDRQWAKQISDATGIPVRAVVGYAAGALGAEYNFPGCGIGWNMLAAIGSIESDHGRHGGGVIDESGRVEPLIFGVPLDGNGVKSIADTDNGEFDGDATVDRAIGPMQIIPQTWRSWAFDGSGDEQPDPHNISDAAVAAGDYLCHRAGELRTPEGWRSGVAAYNAGDDYLRKVAAAAQQYADAAASLADD